MDIPKSVLSQENLARLEELGNPTMMGLVEKYLKLLKPATARQY